ncbi:MAG: outer membrane protein transport protein [Kiritimatiellales bacterium]|nr:outer membrane protein transport protein [Kiritimatiellales bacterium]
MKPHRSYLPLLAACLALPSLLWAVPITIATPGGVVVLDIGHAGPTGQLVEPDPPATAGFRPPTIFAAPLPVGSGARALGQAGAFTAVADDATAASWNPAGLVQLELPEVSAVYRFSAREDTHESRSRELEAGQDSYTSSELNYLSGVYPFLLNDRNAVVSLNYQEAYDFTYEFTARFNGSNQQNVDTTINQTFRNATTNFFSNANQSLTIIADVLTDTESQINQVLDSALLSGIDFRQSGTIDAVSPAFAFEVTPSFSLGVALNFYTDGASRGNPIESSLVADYEGTSDSVAGITDTRNSTALISYDGVRYSGPVENPVETPIPPRSQTNAFADVQTNVQQDIYTVEGSYREENTTDDFHGFNATLGALWAATEKLSLGATVDLPWTGKGSQTKRIDHQVSTFDSNRVEVAHNSFQETQTRDVEYTFPLYWSVGALWRWSDRFYTSMDASRTYWSDYSYKAEGEERINPVNGEPYSSAALDDCWSFRLGGEYLCVLSSTEVPLRGGVFWEQRPASGSPDEYWGFSLGSGISLGKDPGKAVLDIAYIFEQGNNVMGSLLPGQAVRSDTIKHQIFLSAIWHF